MNNKGKSVVGLTLAAIMIASIFAVMAPISADVGSDEVPTGTSGVEPMEMEEIPTGASDVEPMSPGYVYLEKVATKVPKIYNISETITYTIVIWNPNIQTPITITVVNDTYANDVSEYNLLTYWGIPNITLPASDGVKSGPDTYNNTWPAPRPIAATDLDPSLANQVINRLRIAGTEDVGGLGLSGSVQEAVMVRVYPPNFNFTFDPTCCLNMTFNGSASFDPDGTIVNHTWDFGDATTQYKSGAPGVISHIYASCGSKTVNLSGYDNNGMFNITKKEVYVPCAPIAVATASNYSVINGTSTVVEFRGCGSYVDPEAAAKYPGWKIEGYTWTFDDGYLTQYTRNVSRVVDGDLGDVVCATLEVTDGHCNATDGVCVTVIGVPQCRIRLYGTFDEGPGNHTATDPEPGPSFGKKPENPPYTDPIAPFYPQAEQAPEKDFITFNPAIMVHNEGYPELDFVPCDGRDIEEPEEKVFKRMWYEKEWFKDRDGDGCWDVVIEDKDGKYVKTLCLAQEELIHAELMKGNRIREHNNPEDPNDPDRILDADIYGPAIKQEFAYMFLDGYRDPVMIQNGSEVLIPMASRSPVTGDGIDSFDAFIGDGVTRDAVRVESEATLGFDIDQDGVREPMDKDATELNGNEQVVLVLDKKTLHLDDTIQFFDHKVKLTGITGPAGKTATFRVSDNEGGLRFDNPTINEGGIKFFYRAKEYTGTGSKPAFYLKVVAINWDTNTANQVAIVEVGRMFGQTHANIGLNLYWSQKAFIVDEVFYNVVAIKAEDNCIKYIVFREKLPKDDIKLYGKELKAWPPGMTLPEMPPFNEPHEVIVDVQDTGWTLPIEKTGVKEPRPPLSICWVTEGKEERYKGELKEIYNETDMKEFWMTEWFWTLPWQYTEFELPVDDKYLVTLSWIADEACTHIWDDDPRVEPIEVKEGDRFKFWYEDCSGPLYMDYIDKEATIRLYGTFDEGPGNHTATDPEPGSSFGKKPENPPYTDPIAPFYPQSEQAPRKDFITFNPAIMVHNEGYPELDFVLCDNGEIEGPEEKVFKRMWYEKEWFKDRDGDGCWDVVIEDKYGSYVKTLCLAQEELIHAELMKGNRIREHNNPEDPNDPDHVLDADTYGPALKQEFAYMFLDGNRMPVMIQSGSEVLIPMASYEEDNGIDSFDALIGDGVTRDAVRVKSEATLGFDIDKDGKLERMDMDNIELNGNESVVLVLDEKRLHIGDTIQFFDHKVTLTGITGPTGKTATFRVSDNEGGTRSDNPTINEGGTKFFYRAKEYTGTGSKPAFYVKVGPINWDVNPANIVAVVEVGRMFGQTHANIGANLYWSQKAFIVDEVFYNVVAIKAEDDCIKYIVFREKLPKDDIKLYGKELKAWPPHTTLPEMPPFNDVHEIIVDVQDTGWTPSGVPIVKVGRKIPIRALDIKYVDEGIEERFKGELKEIYNETYMQDREEKEFWMTEWFWTKPDQYTAIVLPPLESYLMTLAWYAPESVIHIWDDVPGKPIVKKTGERVKFWYNPMDNTDIYVNRISGGSHTQPATLLEYYDQLLYVGDGDGDPDRNEVIRAILDYLDSLEEPTYPFDPEGPFTIDDLIEYILAYLYTL